jgi:hypothetical protein
MKTQTTFRKEYRTALDAQASGLEGRARVCARRAAGLLIQKYLEKQKTNLVNMNSLDLIKYLQQTSDSSELTLLLGHYSEIVTKDHHLASEIDLVATLPQLAQLLYIDLHEMD